MFLVSCEVRNHMKLLVCLEKEKVFSSNSILTETENKLYFFKLFFGPITYCDKSRFSNGKSTEVCSFCFHLPS